MADRLLLETGDPDGYLLEDGSGVLLLETQPAAAAYAALVAGDGAVSHWRLGETSGTTAFDQISANDGTYTGGYTQNQTGALGLDSDPAVLLNGSTGYIPTGLVGLPTGSANRSLEAWFKGASSHKGTVISYGTQATRQSFAFAVEVDSTIIVWAWSDDHAISAPGIINGNWHHIVVTYAGGTTATVYLDGVSLGTVTFGAVLNTGAGTTLAIGRDYNDVTNYVDGTIDEVAVYNVVLTATQVLSHYQLGLGIIPATKALTTATFAPTVSVSDNQLATPSTKALTLATFAPTVAVSDNQLVTPGLVALATATFAPVVAVSDNQVATPDPAALVATAFVPTVTASDHQTVVPDAVALTLTTFAPDTVLSDHKLVTPDLATLALTAFAPTVAITDATAVVPGTATVTLTTYAPIVTGSAAAGTPFQVVIIG